MALTPQNVVAWHDRTPAEHGALVDKWAAKKFRTLSLGLYGTTVQPLYAAVMVKRPTVIATKQFGPVNQAGMQKAFDEMAKLSARYFASDEAREGMTAFAEKRPPAWAQDV